jgi:energy-coupling factor transporter ATP-binding protein EcfA2
MTTATATRRARGGALGPLEVAEAAVLGDLALVLSLLGFFVPLGPLAFAAQALAAVPFAALASRRRLRAVVAGTVAAAAIGSLVGGPLLAANVGVCAVLGGSLGRQLRRGRGLARTLARSVAVTSGVTVAVFLPILVLLPEVRTLTLEQVRLMGESIEALLRAVGLTDVAQITGDALEWSVTHWLLTVPMLMVGFTAVLGVFALAVGRSAIARLAEAVPPAQAAAVGSAEDIDGAPDPVPLRLVGVGYTYPGASRPALADVTATIPAGKLVAVVGGNGAGKSTLARMLAGMAPSDGHVDRPGRVGLGRVGGTAIIFQRPESQVLAARVRDDVVWGLPTNVPVDVDGLLAEVGLDGFGDRETATLSGGELQRLAIAAALARRPRLLISDESTAMLDASGRSDIVALFRRLVRRHGMTVVHVTHDPHEAAAADVVLALDGAGNDGRHGEVVPFPAPPLPAAAGAGDRPVLELADVGHVYSPGTPWARRALEGVDLRVCAGEGVLLMGANGSGKSTLAWILAGLSAPTEGRVTVSGTAAISFQHARLQLVQPTVEEDVRSAGGVDGEAARRALASVGLDAEEFGPRRVDDLSGGEQRRVVLAGLLARRPSVLILDEPFAGLDLRARAALAGALSRLRRDEGLALVIVSHDLDLADHVVDRVMVLEEGRVVPDGTPALAQVAAGVGGRR